MEYITLRLDSTNEVEQWYVRHNYFIVLLTTNDSTRTNTHSLISSAQKHTYRNPKGNKARPTLRPQGIVQAPQYERRSPQSGTA